MIRNALQAISGWGKEVVDFGVAVIMVGVVVDILFPGTTGVIDNIADLVGDFSSQGVAGIIALLLFVTIYNRLALNRDGISKTALPRVVESIPA